MKKIVILFTLMFVAGFVSLQAQSCSKGAKAKACCSKKSAASAKGDDAKACCSKKTAASCSKTAAQGTTMASLTDVKVIAAASQVAEAEGNIEKRTCSESGKVSFYQKSTCPATGKISVSPVSYNTTTGKFVNLSPTEEAPKAEAKMMTKKQKKQCKKACAKSAKSCTKGSSADAGNQPTKVDLAPKVVRTATK